MLEYRFITVYYPRGIYIETLQLKDQKDEDWRYASRWEAEEFLRSKQDANKQNS